MPPSPIQLVSSQPQQREHSTLQKKLLARLGLLVVGFVVGAVVSISLLQAVLSELNQANTQAEAMLDRLQDAVTRTADLEQALEHADFSHPNDLARASLSVEKTLSALETIEEHPAIRSDALITESFLRARESAVAIRDEISKPSSLPSSPPAAMARTLRDEVATLGTLARRHIGQKQAELSTHLRDLIIGLTIAALVMTNIAIFVLVRTANMILRPVGQLIKGSRELAHEHFDYRIHLNQPGEFGELACAYNSLADQLASNEQKKVKALQHLAVTLNHELNNVINAIELQLTIVNRRSGSDPQLSSHLKEIHVNLERMARTIASLRNVRRVVLTDYMPGEPMLDLPRSTAADDLTVSVMPTAKNLPAGQR